MAVIMILIPILVAPFSAQYTSFFRLHKPLRYYINPLFPVYSGFEFLASNISLADDVGFISRAQNIQNVLDVLAISGVNVSWRDNNSS